MKRCCYCERVLPLEAFSLNRTRRDGRSSRCKPCDSDYQRLRYKPVEVDRRLRQPQDHGVPFPGLLTMRVPQL